MLPKRTGFETGTLWILGTETSPKPLFKLTLIPEPHRTTVGKKLSQLIPWDLVNGVYS